MNKLLEQIRTKHNKARVLLDNAKGVILNAIGHCLAPSCTEENPCSTCKVSYKMEREINEYLATGE